MTLHLSSAPLMLWYMHRFGLEIQESEPISSQHEAAIGVLRFFPTIKITVICQLHPLWSECEDKRVTSRTVHAQD